VQLASIIFWTFGDLGRVSWDEFYILVIVIIPGLIFFIYNRWNISAMNSGDETANSLGVNVEKLRIQMMLVASLTTAVSVSFFGIIAFVGLVVPHIVRRLVGNDERFLIPASALFGGSFLLISDIIARTIISPIVLPVGILTSFIGAPLFIYLLIKGRRGGMWTK
jgi:iron complex transport system permease protein